MDGTTSTDPPAASAGLRCAAAVSTDADLTVAIAAAVHGAVAELGPGARADLAVVFVSQAYGAGIRPAMEHLSETVPARVVLGTTVEGLLT